MVEAGGAAIHSLNKYMAEFIDVLGLHRDTGGTDGVAANARVPLVGGSSVASWDGKVLAQVGALDFPLSLLRARIMVQGVTKQWQQIYDLQAANVSFPDPHSMLQKLGLSALANQSAKDWFRGKVSDKFIEQFADGVSRVNYGQDSSLNAFAEAISLAGAGLVGSLYGVKEGNSKVMEGLIQQAGAALRMDRVTEIRAAAAGGYDVCTGGACETFTSVIVAAPLERAGLKLGPGLSPEVVDRQYQRTIATFVAARGLSGAFFRSGGELVDADTVVTTAAPGIPFNSVAVHGASGDNKVYKLFSATVPSEELLSAMFVNSTAEKAQFDWIAYPVLKPTPHWPPFRLHRSGAGGLYYANAMESPVSCMETEAVGGRNVALLLQQDLQATFRDEQAANMLV